jgi:hypothetical protein
VLHQRGEQVGASVEGEQPPPHCVTERRQHHRGRSRVRGRRQARAEQFADGDRHAAARGIGIDAVPGAGQQRERGAAFARSDPQTGEHGFAAGHRQLEARSVRGLRGRGYGQRHPERQDQAQQQRHRWMWAPGANARAD